MTKRLSNLISLTVLICILGMGSLANAGSLRIEKDGCIFWETLTATSHDCNSEQSETLVQSISEHLNNPSDHQNTGSLTLSLLAAAIRFAQKEAHVAAKVLLIFYNFLILSPHSPASIRQSVFRFSESQANTHIAYQFSIRLRTVVLTC